MLEHPDLTRSLPWESTKDTVSSFMQKVYFWMTGGLALTGFMAWYVASSEVLLEAIVFNRGLFLGLILLELGIVILMTWMASRLSATALSACFVAYSVLNGLTLSVIFVVYTMGSIAQTFFICSGMFAGMSLYGYTTKKDLTSWGSFLFMGLIGIILASVVNWFLHSPAMAYLISFAGIFIFLGLTAYDTQKLKKIALQVGDEESESFLKSTLLGALTLYLDFINLFLMLLRLFGNRR